MIAAGFCLVIVPAEVLGRSVQKTKVWTAQELIEKIKENEENIRSLELHYEEEVSQPKPGQYSQWGYDWGYQAGKFYRVDRILVPRLSREDRHACDGETLYSLGRSETGEFSGGIGARGGWGRGFSLIFGWKRSLSEILRDAQQVTVQKEPDEVDGHLCAVMQANGVIDGAFRVWDYRFWIDTQRGFQPLRVERDWGDPGNLGGREHPEWRLDQIELKKIDGIWFPIKGVKRRFGSKPAPGSKPQPDYCKIKAMYGQKAVIDASMKWWKSVKLVTYEEPAYDIISVDPNSVRINKGIDESKFTIKFPPGCEVEDDFRGSSFKVNDKGELVRLRRRRRAGGSDVLCRRPEGGVAFYGRQATIKRKKEVRVYPNARQPVPIKLMGFKTSSDKIKASCVQGAGVLVFTIELAPNCPKGNWYEHVEYRVSIGGQEKTREIPVYITML
jgi:outer membrane lipoprotein-sorting protein